MSCFLLMFLWLLGAAILGFLLAWLLRNGRIKNLLGENDRQLGLYKTLDGKYQTLGRTKETLESDKLRLMSTQNELNGRIGNLEGNVLDYKTRLATTEGEYEGLNTKFGTLNSTYNTLKSSFDSKMVAFGRLEENYNDTKLRSEKLNGIIAQKETQATEANQRANTLKGDVDRILEEKNRLYAQLEHHKSQQAAKETEWQTVNNDLQEKLNRLTAQNEELSKDRDGLQEEWNNKYVLLSQDRNNLSTERDNLSTELNNNLKQRGVWETRYNKIFSSEQQLSRDVQQIKEQSETLTIQNQNLQSELEQLKNQLGASKSDSQSRIEELERLLANNVQRIEVVGKEKTDLQERLATLQSEKERLNSQLGQVRENNNGEKQQLEANLNKLQAENESLQSRFVTINQDKTALDTRLSNLQISRGQEIQKLEADVANLKSENENLQSTLANANEEKLRLSSTLEEQNTDDLERLQQENKDLLAELSMFRAAVEKRKSGSADNERKRQEVLARIRKRKSQIDFNRIGTGSSEDKDNLKRLRGLGGFVEKKFNAIGIYKFSQVANFMKEDEVKLNEWLELPKDKIQKEEWVLESRRILGLELDTDPTATLARVQSRQKSVNFGRIGTASAANKDDLQRLNDISAFDEAKLNALGIYRFSQIANFSQKDTEAVNEAIEVFEGRINRESWVSQAKQLEASSMEEILARVSERAGNINFSRIGSAVANTKDDLQTINGIGPFIEAKLNAVGIYKFNQIAKFSSEDESTVNEVIELNAGHIQSDEWVRQAKGMA